MTRKPSVILIGLAAAFASPAMAAAEPSTRLIDCGSASCLLVAGDRDSASTAVRLNGHPVIVEGQRHWRTRVPVETVRDWSVPFARTIEVSLFDPRTQRLSSEQADLPIGLMGHGDLASLVVSVN